MSAAGPVLVTGAGGQVGFELLRRAGEFNIETVGHDRTRLDITAPDAVRAVFDRVRPAVVVNAAAYTAVDRAESEPDAARAVNVDGVRVLAEACRERGLPLLHLSTDYVFDGRGQRPYREDDATAPAGVYGATKLAGERALAETLEAHLILRTAWVFGAHGNNFVKTMLRLGRERESLSVVDDQHGTPTPAAAIARALLEICRRYLIEDFLPPGTYHYGARPATTWFAFAREIFARARSRGFAQTPELRPIPTTEYPTPAARPGYSVLDCAKIAEVYGIAAADWRAELDRVLEEVLGGD